MGEESVAKVFFYHLERQTLDDVLFSGSDDISLFLSGRALRELLDELFG